MTPFDVLVVDNHDSFVHTLIDYLGQLGASVRMVEADAIDDADAAVRSADAVVISPGPGDPEHAGASIAVVRAAVERDVPLLGVCLGHQAIAAAFGARVAVAPELVHGMTSDVDHDGTGLYAGMPQPFAATRYHSLAVERTTLPEELDVTARTASGVVMGLRHRSARVEGVQFHPESILTDSGHRLLGNWLEASGLSGAAARGATLHPRRLVD
jgi:para-aminobenzoate synthetase component II